MFEKSLYDLIRGLRTHKGNEKEYIQNCLKECRSEIRSQDMDVKATALLKLIYLEMFGHDMSWASFHVLEVMSSTKYRQKRVGYLGAVQSFRPDTEVLMLAENLLKKDLTASLTTIITLPIAALPHIITPSLALSVLADLLPRLSHSDPTIRKKTIVTLYRLALVYPETLRAAWPKITERLMDKDENPSVTAAIVNVVCELGWRRPHDFLALAPRFFKLLVDGHNNWMAIKLIKLFASLTPLEPRLVRKLLPPLTTIIRTTEAMSLLYECINGIIQGGILGEADDISGREEIASLCVAKLRGMITINSDPNLKYVALLAFNRIVVTHPFLVAQQEDAILQCIDSEDITIRIKALDLVQGMVSSDNLMSIVSRLMRQLRAQSPSTKHQNGSGLSDLPPDSDEETTVTNGHSSPKEQAPLPEGYLVDVIGRILHMCSLNNYSSLVDFEWYIDVLTQLVRIAPVPRRRDVDSEASAAASRTSSADISEKIGDEIRNIAVKVRAVRPAAVRAAESFIRQLSSTSSSAQPVVSGALKPIAWVVGEHAPQLSSAEDTLGYLLQIIPRTVNAEALASCLQSAIKIFALVASDEQVAWTRERKSSVSLLMARIIHTLEPLTQHPYLEVQERAVEFIELIKIAAEAASGQAATTDEVEQDAPLLLTQAIPSLFSGWELNSVALGAQENVPVPHGLDLDEPINPNLQRLLAEADSLTIPVQEDDEFEAYYNQKPPPTSIVNEPAINRIASDTPEEVASSYQQAEEDSYLDPDIVARRKAERLERNRDDPFYIQESGRHAGGTGTPIHNILQNQNGPDLDIDSIPVMQLDIDKLTSGLDKPPTPKERNNNTKPRLLQKIVIAADENLPGSGPSTPRNYESENNSDSFTKSRIKKLKQSLLQVDSSHLESLTLDISKPGGSFDYERQRQEEAEMKQAMKEVERLRLEMQRANERIQVAHGVPAEGTVVKKKKPRKPKPEEDEAQADATKSKVKPKPKKKKVTAVTTSEVDEGAGVVAPAPNTKTGAGAGAAKAKKKKPPRLVQLDDDGGEGSTSR